jgi:hypothetical protein
LILILLGLGGDDLGDSGAVFSVLVTQRLLRLVPGPLGDDSVAGVEDWFSSISSNLLLPATPSVSSSMFQTIGDPLLNGMGSRVDNRFGLGVLLPVYQS